MICPCFGGKFALIQDRHSGFLKKELDLVRLIKKGKQHDSLMKVLTTKSQRRFARWQAKGVVKLSNEDQVESSSSGAGSTQSDCDYEPWFYKSLVDDVKTDYCAANLHLIKRIGIEPKQRDPRAKPEPIP